MLKNLNRYKLIPFVQYSKLWLIISAVAIIIGIGAMLNNSRTIGGPLFLGIDFTGGSFVALQLDEPGNSRRIAEIASKYSSGEPLVQLRRKDPREIEIRLHIDTREAATDAEQNTMRVDKIRQMIQDIAAEYGGSSSVVSAAGDTAQMEPQVADDTQAATPSGEANPPEEQHKNDAADAASVSEEALGGQEAPAESAAASATEGEVENPETPAKNGTEGTTAAKGAEGGVTILAEDYVGPTVGSELMRNAIIALILGMLAIMIYIFIRFNRFIFALAAVIALVHDVMITLGGTAILRLEVNSFYIAVILTIIGFSINDTIIIYDRIRENLRNFPQMNFPTVINLSLTQTLTRSLLTVGTVIVMLVALLLFGGAAIYSFAMSMLIGNIVGSYSSVFIAAPIVLFFTPEGKRVRIPRAIDLLAAQEQAVLGTFDEEEVVVEEEEPPGDEKMELAPAPARSARGTEKPQPERGPTIGKQEKIGKKKRKVRRR